MYTTKRAVIKAFWEANPTLSKKRYRYSWSQLDKTAELVYPIDTRCAFVDYVDGLQKANLITEKMAESITL